MWLVNGVAQFEVHNFLDRAKGAISWSHVKTFFTKWSWPVARASKGQERLRGMWGGKRETSCKKAFKCSASDMLDLYPVLRCFVKQVVMPIGILAAEIESILKMMDCLDVLVDIMHGDRTAEAAGLLDARTKLYLTCFQRCNELNDTKPKHHYALHLPAQMLKHVLGFCMALLP